jgi:predicted naringenin-chalcone synthase
MAASARSAFINRIATAVPPNDVHEAFVRLASRRLEDRPRSARLFERMVRNCGIEHRYSFFRPALPEQTSVDEQEFFRPGRFPDTGERMRFFERYSPALAAEAVERLELGAERSRVTHLIVTCCTGLVSPGLDLELIGRCGLPGSVERSTLGFMGCHAAINALRLSRHIVRSDRHARVLVVSLELCTLHLQDTNELEQMLSFLLWGDGAAACLVTAEPPGVSLEGFKAMLAENTRELITWSVGDSGFDMVLSGRVPHVIRETLEQRRGEILEGRAPRDIDLWAVHPGGRSVLDAVERGLELEPQALSASRDVLATYGNMSSATVLFVLERLMAGSPSDASGCAMSFGPGLVAETMTFRTVR